MPELLEVARVDAILADLAIPSPTEHVPLEAALGRVLRASVAADRDLPPFHRVMMDGYAIRHQDLESVSRFHVQGSAFAGSPRQSLPEAAGSALEVMTGSPLPDGADCVIPFEDTASEPDGFRLTAPERPEPDQFIHRQGSDFPRGTILVEPGCRLGSLQIGTAASCGCARIEVAKPPVISIFGTGDELVPVEACPAAHQIRRSNAAAVAAALNADGIPVHAIDHLVDDPETQQPRLADAVDQSDVVVISGAVSKGRLDWIPRALNALGSCQFHGVKQRPGKPMGVWTTPSGTIIFALPGNPVSTLVGAHRYVLPFIRRCLGERAQPTGVRLAEAVSFDRPLTLFLPVCLQEGGTALPRPVNNSGDYAGLIGSDGFVELPSNENRWTAGTIAPFHPWH